MMSNMTRSIVAQLLRLGEGQSEPFWDTEGFWD